MQHIDSYYSRVISGPLNPFLYRFIRLWALPSIRLIWRIRRTGKRHIPRSGPVILVANHRSFVDCFMVAVLTRRPVYFVAKKELFKNPIAGKILNSLGGLPVDRNNADERMIQAARAVLERGECLAIFPEGTRVSKDHLGEPRKGFGRLALETGAAVVPIAMIGTDTAKRRLLRLPGRVRIRVGRPHFYQRYIDPSPELAHSVMARVWASIELQWEWLGGKASPPPSLQPPTELEQETTTG